MSDSPSPKEQRSPTRVWPRAGEVILLLIAAFCLLVLLTQDFGLVTRFFYSPLAIILLIVVFVEYLIIKGGDRSRLYLLELERMREREEEQVARIRRACDEIRRLRTPAASADGTPAPETLPSPLDESLKRVEHLLRPDLKE
jgi:amino acid permease